MDKDFILLFKEAIEREGSVNNEDKFRDYDEWNSLAYLSVIAMIDEEFDVIIEGNTFRTLNTVGDIIAEIQKQTA